MILRAGHKLIAGALLALSPLCMALDVKLVDDSGNPLTHAVVALFPVDKPRPAENPGKPMRAEVDQRDRQFVPYVSAVMAGTEVHFPNSDNIRHHVYSFSPAKRFELRLYHGTTAEPVRFEQAGKVVLGCNIHDDMLGYIYVVDTPFFAVTDRTGRANFADFPERKLHYQIQHPQLIEPVQGQLSVSAEAVTLTIGALAPDPRESQPRTELEALFDR